MEDKNIPKGCPEDRHVQLQKPGPFDITFHQNDKTARLFINEDGKFDVEGDLAEGAEVFFKEMVYKMCDKYINDRLREARTSTIPVQRKKEK